VHNQMELGHICEGIDLVGVNNRDLKDFTIDVNRSIELSEIIPAGLIKVSESGINSKDTIKILRDVGYDGFLMGENFMKEKNPGVAFGEFVTGLRQSLKFS